MSINGRNGKIPPLDKVPAHAGRHGGIRPQAAADLRDLPGVAPVEGVIFRDNARHSHGPAPFRQVNAGLSIFFLGFAKKMVV